MDLYRLNRDELEYELLVRGFVDVSIETNFSMRRKLKGLTRDEQFGTLVTADSFNPDVVEEVDICNKKVIDLETYLTGRDDIEANSNEARVIDAKLQHLFSRLKRLTPPDDQLRNSISNLNTRLHEIECFLDEKINSAEVDDQRHVVPPIPIAPTTTSINTRHTSVPVYKWDIRFSGAKEGLSVNAFIERVEEYRISRGVSESDLYNSVTDLLTGKALSWYRSVKGKIADWPEFVSKLRENYLPYNFQKDLFKEIQEREQGPKESVSEFFSCMLNYFGRLQKKLSELEKIEIIYSNLDPFYIERVGLHIKDIYTIDKLQELCQSLEVSKNMAAKRKVFHSINKNPNNFLEPDLVYEHMSDYQTSSPSTSGNRRLVTKISSIQCWNCKDSGHKFTECKTPRTKSFCFRCGRAGVTKFSCECSAKNGSDDRRSAGRRS